MRTLLVIVLLSVTICSQALADNEKARILANSGNFKAAFDEWSVLANSGDAEAQYSLGRMYARGDGVKKDFAEARKWFEQAGQQGHALAYHKLGLLYQNGDGVAQDPGQALAYFEKSAELGCQESGRYADQIRKKLPVSSETQSAPAVQPKFSEDPALNWNEIIAERKRIN